MAFQKFQLFRIRRGQLDFVPALLASFYHGKRAEDFLLADRSLGTWV